MEKRPTNWMMVVSVACFVAAVIIFIIVQNWWLLTFALASQTAIVAHVWSERGTLTDYFKK